MYAAGDGVPRDPALALSFLRLAATQGHDGARAQISALESGQVPPAPTPRASAPAQSSVPPPAGSAQASPLSMTECRRFPVYETQFVFQLVALCERAVAGDPAALLALGNLYDAGQRVPRDEQRAVRLFRLAAAAGYLPARHRLTSMGYSASGEPQASPGDPRKRY